MKQFTCFSLLCALVASIFAAGCASPGTKSTADNRIYEMRVYYAAEGKIDALHARFRDHTMRLFEKYGIQNVGYWVPVNNTENKLVFLLAYPSRAARDIAWQGFVSDPEWKKVQAESEANGKLVLKVEQTFLHATDYSPALRTGDVSGGGVYELRTYITRPGYLSNLDDRFRKHTMKFFEKYGMNNWMYFHMSREQSGAATTLIYFLTHRSPEAARQSFEAFRKDPRWIKAKASTEVDGPLTIPDGITSELLVPTDYSPSR